MFLKEDPEHLLELAHIYEEIYDISTAVLFYRRAHQIKPTPQNKEKIKLLMKIRGLQLLETGSGKNILEDT